MYIQDNILTLNRVKETKEVTLEGRCEAHRRVVWARECGGMLNASHRKCLTEEGVQVKNLKEDLNVGSGAVFKCRKWAGRCKAGNGPLKGEK